GQLRRLERLWRDHTTRHIRHWLPQATAILTNSRYTEKVLLERIPGCRGKTIPAMVGVDPFFLEPPLAPDEKPKVPQLITVTRLSEPRKNVHRVIEALARLRYRHPFHYTVVGEGNQRPELERLVERKGLCGRVTFTGSLPRPALRERLRRADLFILTASVLPTSHEGFGLVYLEAAACGVPSLAARLAGAAEAVAEGESGYFVDEPTVAAIADALSRFLEGELRFSRTRCRAFARQFGWERVVERALPFYLQGARL
ncbi:MAG TPA: glycosyltransferase, partial [Methylothermaceae bacterium]|nr:glycosyltransferase [Methylothermaceae bacterium]